MQTWQLTDGDCSLEEITEDMDGHTHSVEGVPWEMAGLGLSLDTQDED